MLAGSLAALALALAVSPAGRAAARAQPITPLRQSVAGNETQAFSARFFDAAGNPSAGETVTFANDACGRFANGGFSILQKTDASGEASAVFRAFPQGITCTVVASAGATVRWNVLTYNPADARLVASLPGDIRPGERYTLNAAAMYGAYRLYNVDIAARIVPGAASASLAPSAANSAQQGGVDFTVTPDGHVGSYAVELAWRDKVQRVDVPASPHPWQDLWWAGPGENGWGMSIVQHRDVLFSVIYAYDAQGRPTWYVMPDGTWNPARTAFTGALYRPHGSPYSAYDASRFAVGEPVGTATIAFADLAHATLDYTIAGLAGRKALTRQPFGPAEAAAAPDVGDMWWGGVAQNGWGIAVLRQYRTLFCVWFTYDASGNPTWLVMPSGAWSDAQTWQGTIYRATGAPWLGARYDPAALALQSVGRFRLRFAGDTASLDYTIGGASATLTLQRQPF